MIDEKQPRIGHVPPISNLRTQKSIKASKANSRALKDLAYA